MKPLIVDEARFQKAVDAFDAYNAQDPNEEMVNGVSIPKELLYAQRMSKRLLEFLPDANESLQLAARSQHIGRWEIARSNFPMDKKGYFQWRNELKKHHASIAWRILNKCGYGSESIEAVCLLLLKKDLNNNPDTQILEDVICLVFLEYYVDEFATKYDDAKIIDILRKTAKKMSSHGLNAVSQIPLSSKIKMLIHEAVGG